MIKAVKTAATRVSRLSVVIAVTLLLLQPSCTFVKLRRDLRQMATHGELWGQVSNLPSPGTPSYVLIFSNDPVNPQLIEWEHVKEDGDYSVLVPAGVEFQIVAFADLNGNRRWDTGEPADLATGISVEPVTSGEKMRGVSFSLKAISSIPGSLKVTIPWDILQEHTSAAIVLGDVISLDEPRFSADVGHVGLWDPYKFLESYGTGIFFLEPYDPKRIPVLFVYGAEGSPQDWRYIIANMDRSRFQAWFFHYATGIRLESWSLELNSLVERLHESLRFEKLFVVAHSMGGLVARDFVLHNTLDDHHSYVRRLVTISTPWEGHNAAGVGARLSPIVVPSWNDLRPGSSFLSSLFHRRLPPGVSYYLIFGFKHALRPWLPPDNDGVVGLASELSLPAQYEARRVFGLNLDHTAILESPEMLRKLEEFLSEQP